MIVLKDMQPLQVPEFLQIHLNLLYLHFVNVQHAALFTLRIDCLLGFMKTNKISLLRIVSSGFLEMF